MSYEENATDGGIAKDHKENLQQGNIDTKHKSWAIIKTSTFQSLLAGLFNSWDKTSKKVMYKKVPPAIP